MENSTKIALLAGGCFLAGASYNGYLTRREERLKEAARKERQMRERIENQEGEIEDLKWRLDQMKGGSA